MRLGRRSGNERAPDPSVAIPFKALHDTKIHLGAFFIYSHPSQIATMRKQRCLDTYDSDMFKPVAVCHNTQTEVF